MARRLLIFSGILLLLLILVLAIGERSLPLFGGDRDLAARVTVAYCLWTMGVMLGCAMPAMTAGYANRVQRVIAFGGSEHAIAQRVRAPGFLPGMQKAGYGLMIFFVCGGFAMAAHFWWSGVVPGQTLPSPAR